MKSLLFLVLTTLFGNKVFSAPLISCHVFEVRAVFASEQCQSNCTETVGPLYVTSATLNTPGIVKLSGSSPDKMLQYSVEINSTSGIPPEFKVGLVLNSSGSKSATLYTEGSWNASEGIHAIASFLNEEQSSTFLAGELLEADLICSEK